MHNHEIGPPSGTNDSENEQQDAGSQGFVADPHAEETDENPAHNENYANTDPEVSTPIYGWTVELWRRFTRWKHDPFREKAHWSNVATIFLTGVIVIVGTFQACIYRGQLTVMSSQLREIIKQYPELQKSAKGAEDAAEVNKEALYSVQRAFLTFPPSPTIDVFANLPNNASPLFQLTMPIENSGVTPAHQVVDRVSCVTPMGPVPTNYAFPDRTGSCGTPWAATGASVIPAKSNVQSQGVYVDFQFVKEFAEQSHGPWLGHIGRPDHPTRTIYFYGWVTSRDIFEHTPEHLSEFCRALIVLRIQQGKAENAWGYCPMHNCTDEECPDYKQRIEAAHAALKCCPTTWFPKKSK
jgi:hypothetical protein